MKPITIKEYKENHLSAEHGLKGLLYSFIHAQSWTLKTHAEDEGLTLPRHALLIDLNDVYRFGLMKEELDTFFENLDYDAGMGVSSCIWCFKYNKECDMCSYGKRHGKCAYYKDSNDYGKIWGSLSSPKSCNISLSSLYQATYQVWKEGLKNENY